MSEKSLVGRYIKALIDVPLGIGNSKKNDIFKIVNDFSRTAVIIWTNGDDKRLESLKNINWTYNFNAFELLPEDYVLPTEQTKKGEKTYNYVQVNNKEEFAFVAEKLGRDKSLRNYGKSFINLSNPDQSWGSSNGDPYYTFDEWCRINNYEFPIKKKQEYTYIVVHTPTKEQLDFACKKLGYENTDGWWKSYNKETCITINEKGYGNEKWFSENNSLIYSFDEWCKEFGHVFQKYSEQRFIPGKWYYYLKDRYIMKCLYFEKNTFNNDGYIDLSRGKHYQQKSNYYNLQDFGREATLEEIQPFLPDGHVDKSVSKENSLIEEAKKRYPIGTRFIPAHIPNSKDYCIVTNDNFKLNTHGIYSLTDNGIKFSNDKKYGTTGCNRIIYYEGKWAEILPSTKQNPNTDFIFEPGGIYVGEFGYKVIFKTFTGRLYERCQLINCGDMYTDTDKGCCTFNSVKFRKATEEEKRHLEACIKANKFVPLEEALKPTEINIRDAWTEQNERQSSSEDKYIQKPSLLSLLDDDNDFNII